MTSTNKRRARESAHAFRKLSDGLQFGVYTPGEFRSPQGELWLAHVHGVGSRGGCPHDWLWFRCMRSGQRVTVPLDGSWRARRLEWIEVARETGIEDPYRRGRREPSWMPQSDHLEFSAVARGVFELARARDLPDEGEIGLLARECDWRASRNPAFAGLHVGLAWLAAAVLDRVLPPLGHDDLFDRPARVQEPMPPRAALRAVVDAAATAERRGGRYAGRPEPILSAAETWEQSGWKAACGDLEHCIAAAGARFEARRDGERDGQGALFNALTLDR